MQKILLHTCCGPCSLMPLEYLMQENLLPSAYFFNPNIHLQNEYLLRLYAMQEVAKYFSIPLIIQGNAEYNTKIKLYNTCSQKNITAINRLALSHCTPFLFTKNTENKEERKWKTALHKILNKWKKYAEEFPQFQKNLQTSKHTIKLIQSMQDQSYEREVHINAPHFIARLSHNFDTHHVYDTCDTNLQSIVIAQENSPFSEGERCKKCYEERLYQTALFAIHNGFKRFTTTLLYSRYQNHQDICSAAYNAEERVNKETKTNPSLSPIHFYYKDFRPLWQEGIDKSKELNLYRQKWCGCNLSRMESLERMAKRVYERNN